MSRSTCTGLALCAAALAVFPEAAAGSGDVEAACLAALRTEGRRAWEQAERFSHSVVVSCRALRTDRYRVDGAWREDVEVTRLRISLNRERNLRLVETHFPDLPWTHRSVVNEAYRFCVSQKPQPKQTTSSAEPASPWQLLSGHEAPAAELWATTVPFEPQHIWFAEASYQLLTVPLAEIVNSPNFHVQVAWPASRPTPRENGRSVSRRFT